MATRWEWFKPEHIRSTHGAALDRLLCQIEYAVERLTSRRLLVITVFTTFYSVLTVQLAAHKLFWEDELFTVYISAGNWTEILKALATGADQHPPSFYYLTHLITNLLGPAHVTVRATAIFGFWLMCVCLNEIGRRLMSPAWGAVLMLLPCVSAHYLYYASEARGYGLMCGFTALAVLSWLVATCDEHRALTIPLLFASLAGTVGSHYYGIFVLLPLGIAEVARTVLQRRIDWPIWLGFLGGLVPPVAFWGIIQGAHGYSAHFWAKPSLSTVFKSYPPGYFWIAALVSTLAVPLRKSSERPPPIARPWIWWCLLGLALLPFIILLAAVFVTHAFAPRYALGSGIGVLTMVCYAIFRFTSRRVAAAAVLVGVELACFVTQFIVFRSRYQQELESTRKAYALVSDAVGDSPLAVAEITVFHRLAFYGPVKLARQISYLADPDLQNRYLGFDTIDRGLLELTPWFPINIRPYGSYLRSHQNFFVFGYIGAWSWLTYSLPDYGGVTLRDRLKDSLLFSFTRDPKRTDTLPPAVPERQMLFDKLSKGTRPICQSFLEPKSCPALN
jgi:hypothetical protein